jgi:hypothetical protein
LPKSGFSRAPRSTGSWTGASKLGEARRADAQCSRTSSGPGAVSLTSFRTGRPHRSWRARRSGWSWKAAVLYHHISRILPRSDLDDASGWKLWSDPPESASRSALDLHGLVWANFYLNLWLAWSPDPPDDDQLALRYSGSGDEYFRTRAPIPSDHQGCCGS